jgi:hypothetical protein
MYRCRTMTTYYMYDTIRRINSDVEHMYGSNRFSVLCRCLTNYEFEMRVLPETMRIIHGFRTRDPVSCAVYEISSLSI